MKYEEALQELSCDECSKAYCFLKFVLKHHQVDRRVLVQLKCIEKFKYEESFVEGRDLGEEESTFRWIDNGYAKAFSEVFSENKGFEQIYRETVSLVNDSSQA